MSRQACKTVYQFNELSDEAKDKAIENYRQAGFDYEWWNYIFEDAKRMGVLMGITVDNIYFSGFSSQGDGACFEGSYEYQKGSVKAIREETGDSDKDLTAIAKGLQAEQRRNFYGLSASVKHRGH